MRDTLVVGAGIIGASVAWRLARAGQRVTLLDAGTTGGEASWAGAGMLAPGGEVQARDDWSELALESHRMYPEFVARLESESGVGIDLRRCGSVEVAFDAGELQALVQRAEQQRPLNISSTILDLRALREMVPLFDRGAAGAIYYPDDAMVDPRDIMRALRVACLAADVEIREGWRVSAVRALAGSVSVENHQGDALDAANAVLAAGAWSDEIAVSSIDMPPRPRAFPVKGHLTGYQFEPGLLGPILRRGHTYLLQRSSGFTLAGTTTEHVGFERLVHEEVVNDITERVCELLPWLRGREVSTAWTGFRPAAESPIPVICRAGDSGLWLAYGHYRNGILLAPITAEIVSREIAGAGAR